MDMGESRARERGLEASERLTDLAIRAVEEVCEEYHLPKRWVYHELAKIAKNLGNL